MFATALLLSLLGPLAASAAQPEPVHEIRRAGQMPAAWYAEQARQWAQQVKTNPADPTAWRYYYFATEYMYRTRDDKEAGRARLDQIIAAMEQAVPNSAEFPYLKSRHGPRQIALLEEASRRCPDCGGIAEDLGIAYELEGDTTQARRAWEALVRSQDLAPALLDYNYNLLMSTQGRAVLLTNGDNDTIPAWLLQRTKGVRPDVLVLNLFLIDNDRSYLARALKQHGIPIETGDLPAGDKPAFLATLCQRLHQADPDLPIYLATTVAQAFKAALADKLYLTGLASRYSDQRLDNIALLKRNLEQRFRLDLLRHDWYEDNHLSTELEIKRLNGNYAVPFAALAEHYQTAAAAPSAAHWRDLALRTAQRSGNKPFLEELQKRLGHIP